eukprot:8075035-Alexandrium_andersonii.AAC.1
MKGRVMSEQGRSGGNASAMSQRVRLPLRAHNVGALRWQPHGPASLRSTGRAALAAPVCTARVRRHRSHGGAPRCGASFAASP